MVTIKHWHGALKAALPIIACLFLLFPAGSVICNCVQDEHGLVIVLPSLASRPDLTKVVVTCSTDVIDLDQHRARGEMHKICFAFYHSFSRDTRFTKEVYQAFIKQCQHLNLE